MMAYALTPSERSPYTSRAIKATGLLEETRALLRAWRMGETSADFRRRAREEGLLGKATASRTDDVVGHAFSPRFLLPSRPPAAHLKKLLEALGSGPWFRDLSLLYAARADVVLHEAVTVYAAERLSTGRPYADTSSFVEFLHRQEAAGRMEHPWSPSVKASVARHILRQLTDFGHAGPPRRGARELWPYEPTRLGVAWLAYDLHFAGLTDSAVVAHEDWALWNLREGQVREWMSLQAGSELWEFQAGGSVVQVTWACSSMEEAADVFARRRLS